MCGSCHSKTNGRREYWIEYFSRGFNISKIFFTYEDIQNDCKDLAVKLQNIKIEGIVPIPRGGIIPGIILSYLLDKPIKMKVTSEKDIFIDEIVDFGMTFREIQKKFPNNLFVCLHLNQNHYRFRKFPDFYIRKVTDWIVYPWETYPREET